MRNTNLSEDKQKFFMSKNALTMAKERSAPTEREICRSER